MQLNTGNISHKIIQAQMKNIPIRFDKLPIQKELKFGLYSYEQKPIYTQIKQNIDFSQQSYIRNNSLFYIDHGAAGHLGVSYVVVKKSNLDTKTKALLKDILITIFIAYLIVAFIGYYLAKLFIYPIQSQREQLNIFIKNATHELNTPVSALLLCANSNNFFTQNNRNLIKISAKKISNLYKDLSYITLKKHKSENLENLELSKTLQRELSYHNILAEKKKISLKSELKETFFKIDEEDFIRLTNNLITNAIKYTKRHGSIKIVLKNRTLIVEDNGIGIDKDKLNQIFKRYYRATDEVGGFGIGLDIVYSICKTYGIKISVDSKKDEGTLFSLNFSAGD